MTKDNSVFHGAKKDSESASTTPLIQIHDTEPHTLNLSSKNIGDRHRSSSCKPRTAKDAPDIFPLWTKHEIQGSFFPEASTIRTNHIRSKSDCILDGSLQDVKEGRAGSHLEFPVWNHKSREFPAPDHAELEPHWRCIGSNKITSARCSNSNDHSDLAVGALTSLRGQQVPLNDLVNVAEKLLCTRWHKWQAGDIGRVWLENLNSSPETPASSTSAVSDEVYSSWSTPSSRKLGTEALHTPHTSPSESPLYRKSADIESPTLRRYKLTEPGRPLPSHDSFGKDGHQTKPKRLDLSYFENTADNKTRSEYPDFKDEENSKLTDASDLINKSLGDRRIPRRKLSFDGILNDEQRRKESTGKPIISTKQDLLRAVASSEHHQTSHSLQSYRARASSCSNPTDVVESPSTRHSSDAGVRVTETGRSVKIDSLIDSAPDSQKNGRCTMQASRVESDEHRVEEIIVAPSRTLIKSEYELNATGRALEEVLDLHQSVCSGLTTKFKRCTNLVKGDNWPEACDTLDRLRKLNADNEMTGFLDELKRLACLVTCKRNHLRKVDIVLEDWWEKLGHSPGKLQGHQFPDMRNKSKGQAIIRPGVPQHDSLGGKKVPIFRNEITLRSGMKYAWDSCHENTVIRNFLPYRPKTRSNVGVEKAVEGAIKRPLLKSESMLGHEGWIYVYWFPGNFGLLKIGATTKNITHRLRGWERQCKHSVYLLYPEFSDECGPMPHVFRVEKLIQTELRSRRREEPRCQGCFRSHTEWFEINIPDAKKVVQKWSSWIRNNPYEEVQGSVEGNGVSAWRLRDEEQCNLRRLIDNPLNKESVDVPQKLSPPKLRSRTRSSENRRPRSHSRNLVVPASRSTRNFRSSSADVRGPLWQTPTSEMPDKGVTLGRTCEDDLDIKNDTT